MQAMRLATIAAALLAGCQTGDRVESPAGPEPTTLVRERATGPMTSAQLDAVAPTFDRLLAAGLPQEAIEQFQSFCRFVPDEDWGNIEEIFIGNLLYRDRIREVDLRATFTTHNDGTAILVYGTPPLDDLDVCYLSWEPWTGGTEDGGVVFQHIQANGFRTDFVLTPLDHPDQFTASFENSGGIQMSGELRRLALNN